MILAALVLGAAYLASRPGSDTPAANGQESAPEFAAIERFVQDEMAAQRIPGLALGIVEDDRITYLRGFGKADDSGRPVTPQTPFIIGSVSKSFTALAIMQLVEAGKDRTRRARAALPAVVPRRGRGELPRAITVRHLLNQTSGLSTKTGRTFQGNGDISDAALEKTVRKLSSVELTAPVGTKHQYSTVNYSVLGLIVQTVAGRSYESYVQTEILDPLQMRGSFTSAAAAEQHGLATGYHYWFGRPRAADLPYNRGLVPAGYLISDAEDMTHYLIAQLNGGRYRSASVLSPDGSRRAPPAGRPDTGDGHLVRDGLVRRSDQRDPGDPPPGRDVQLPRERRARARQPDGSHRADERGELRRPVPQRSHGHDLRGRDESSRGTRSRSRRRRDRATFVVYALLFGVLVLQLRGIVRWVAALRRGHLPRGRVRPRLRIGLWLGAAASAGRSSSSSSCRSSSACRSSSSLRGLPDLAYVLLLSGRSLCVGGSSERSGRTRRSDRAAAQPRRLPDRRRPAAAASQS